MGLRTWLDFWPIVVDLLACGAILGMAHSVHFYRRFRDREHRALFLESTLAAARLDALRAQLHPHFLFNSLNAITTLLRRDPRLAESTLMSLSELLRQALNQSEKPEIPLREEIDFVRNYLDIQQTRFGGDLRVEQEIEPAAQDCLVPTLVLQPLVENALRHGIEPADNRGLVRVTARRSDGRLVLTVEDDGAGLAAREAADPQRPSPLPAASRASSEPGAGTGIGLANLRLRLQTLYGDQQSLQLASRAGGGVIVRLELPWRPASCSSPATAQPA